MSEQMIRHGRRALLLAAAGAALPTARAQSFPARPIRIVIGAPAGALPDLMVRSLADAVKDDLGQPVLADNKPGAASNLAAEAVARSPADGYTLLLANDALLTVNPLIYAKAGFDPAKDFRAVSMLGATSGVLVASPKLGVKSFPELVQLAQSKPGAIDFASGGVGHPTHLATVRVAKAANIQLTHVPYRGTPQAIQGVAAGEVGLTSTGVIEALPFIKSGRIVAIAATGAPIKELLPDTPHITEFLPDFKLETWFALMAPSGTPDAVVQRLNAAVTKAIEQGSLKRQWFELGVRAASGAPSVVEARLQEGAREYGPLIKALDLKVE